MRPPDAITGWDNEHNAQLYQRFTRDYPLYTDTSRDLAARADLNRSRLAVDLCGGTGTTAAIMLERMPPHSRVISIDNAHAMQTIGRRSHSDPRITWIHAQAEHLADQITEPIEAIVCNSGIWKTNTCAVFAAAQRALRPGGRLVFNIGGGFAGLTSPADHTTTTPTLNALITAIAEADYGYVRDQPQNAQPILTPATIITQLTAAGFTILACETLTYSSTVQEKRAWLSIPLFARPPGQLTFAQRMQILQRAYRQVDKSQPTITKWLVVTAQA